MKKQAPRILMGLAVLSLLLVLFFPIWRITLIAPQFPEGLYMEIWVNKITGQDEYVLQNVNILNHYIGMQSIEEDEIPELQFFPYVIGALSLLGLVALVGNKKKWYLTWCLVLAVLGVLAVADFYKWEYDYGHNLDPEAPIKVPGQNYQPPLIGDKMLLNFRAISYPSMGSYLMLGAILFSFLAYWAKRRNHSAGTAMILMGLFLGACQPQAEKIRFGEDQGTWCKMMISDSKYGAELVTRKGKVYKFDAVECMLYYIDENAAQEFAITRVVPFDKPGNLSEPSSLYYLVSPNLSSPMNANITAFAGKKTAEKMKEEYRGKIYSWEELKQWFKTEYIPKNNS